MNNRCHSNWIGTADPLRTAIAKESRRSMFFMSHVVSKAAPVFSQPILLQLLLRKCLPAKRSSQSALQTDRSRNSPLELGL